MEEQEQARNWSSAQAISIGIPLVPSALQQLLFLAEVDRHRCLYGGPAVSYAIQRYEECWLPLLAEFSEHGPTVPLQPPLDCAWIWHCHRLNPKMYASDCKLLFGRILDVPSTVHDTTDAIQMTLTLWAERFPQENYCIDLFQFQYEDEWRPNADITGRRKIKYNLEEAVMRQKGFYYQVSQPHMKEESFLRVAEQRYKGFLHLFKMTNSKVFLVPTYDIDLMWHAHQLNPRAYREDLTNIVGKVLEHDDTDTNRNPGQRLDEGFQKTCQLWQESYGSAYERAGAMYRGEPPAPIHSQSSTSTITKPSTVVGAPLNFNPIASREVMKVCLTIVKAQDLPQKHATIQVRLRVMRKCRDFTLETASIPLPEAVWKHTWTFEAEQSTEGLILELLLRPSNKIKQVFEGSKVLGYCHLSWQSVLSRPTLSFDGWLTLSPISASSKNCPSLFISLSLTNPQPAPHLFRIINSIPTDDRGHMGKGGFFDRRGCWLTRTVLDHANRQVFIIRARYSDGHTRTPESEKRIFIHEGGWEYQSRHSTKGTAPAKVVAIATPVVMGQGSRELRRCWGFFENSTQLLVSGSTADPSWNIRPTLELHGNLKDQICLVNGRKLDYELQGASAEEEGGFVTLIRYGLIDAPNGKSTALFNWRTGAIEVSPEESVVLVLLLSSIISMSVLDMEGVKVKFNPRRKPPSRSITSSDEWGSVVLNSRDQLSATNSMNMMRYYRWWAMEPILWSSTFYSPQNAMFGASGCGAAGACGAGACGGSACGGAGCGGAAGGGCGGGGGGGGGCGGGGGGGGGCGGGGGGC